jgi:hypothetical protein
MNSKSKRITKEMRWGEKKEKLLDLKIFLKFCKNSNRLTHFRPVSLWTLNRLCRVVGVKEQRGPRGEKP